MKPTPWRYLTFLLMIAFAIRLAAGWAWQSRIDGRFAMGDSESYWTLGRTIAEGKPYEYGAERACVFRTPGYPILLAPIFRLTDDDRTAVLLARAEAALLGTLAVAGVGWFTRLLFDDRTALIAATLAAFYPGAISSSVMILSEAPFCPLMLLQLALWTAASKAQSNRNTALLSFCGGLAAGAATLMRPSWLLFTPFAVIIGILTQLAISRRQLVIGSCMILGLALAMLPWWIRNARVTDHFVPTTLQVGASLYDGLSPEATGASNMEFVPHFIAEQQQETTQPSNAANDSFEWRLDRRLRTAAVTWALEHPGQAIRLAGIKFLRMWNVWPNEARLSSWPFRWAVFFTYTPLLFFAIIGVWRTLDRGWPYILCWLPAVYLTLLHMVFVSSIRYREPAMLALLALAGLGIGDWGLGIRKERRAVSISNP